MSAGSSKDQLLREAQDALDAIASARDDARWDLAKRIDAALAPNAPETPQPTSKERGCRHDLVRSRADGSWRCANCTEPVTVRLASETPDCTVGVGDGSGQLFVHGSYEAVKRVQAMVLELEQFRRIAQETGCVHCREVYRIWEANQVGSPERVMIQMRDAAAVGMFRPQHLKRESEKV